MRQPAWLTKRKLLIGMIAVLSIGVFAIGVFGAGMLIDYVTWPKWTGFEEDKTISTSTAIKKDETTVTTTEKPESGKTLWDLLSVLVVPVSVVGLGFLLQQLQQKRIDEEAKEEALQAYFDRLSTLLVDKNLIAIAKNIKKDSEGDKELAEAAKDLIQAWTVSILRRLKEDDERSSNVIQFLIDTEVISTLKLTINRFDLKNFNLRGVNFKDANLEGIDFKSKDLRNANFQESRLQGAKFEGAELENADFGGADLQGANLRGAKLKGANFYSVSFYPEDDNFFNKTDLSEADLRDADLRGANLSGVNLSKAKLSKAQLDGAQFTQVYEWYEEVWDGNYIAHSKKISANLGDAEFCKVRFGDMDLEGVNIAGANLREADLSKVQGLNKRQLFAAKLCRTELPEEFRSMSNLHCELLEITTEPG